MFDISLAQQYLFLLPKKGVYSSYTLGAPRMQRLQILLLIATLALMVAWLMGRATEITGQHRQYQANTVKDRVVLSTIFIGLKVIDDTRITLRLTDILAAMTSLDEILRSHCPAE